jgi:hypothetical protein
VVHKIRKGGKDWNKLSIEEQDIIADRFFKDRDTYAWTEDGYPTLPFKKYLKQEGYYGS